jgi:hypothetical protein
LTSIVEPPEWMFIKIWSSVSASAHLPLTSHSTSSIKIWWHLYAGEPSVTPDTLQSWVASSNASCSPIPCSTIVLLASGRSSRVRRIEGRSRPTTCWASLEVGTSGSIRGGLAKSGGGAGNFAAPLALGDDG